MSKFELSLAKEYVPTWGVVEAVRELFQNALDQQTTVEDNTMFFEYYEDTESLHIGNKLSVLSTSSLLLGASTKRDDNKTIGQFGEGYKIATLVLTRLGKQVRFFNYGAREVWSARFVKSKRYNAEVLTFFVNKSYPWLKVPDNNLTIIIEGITPEEYQQIVEANLHTQEGYRYWQTTKGRILLEPDLKGKMFVNGLYICTAEDFHFGYDFKPDQVKLDRDRGLIKDFDLQWNTSQMWASLDDNDEYGWDYDTIDMAGQLVAKNAPDVKYLKQSNEWKNDTKYKAIQEQVVDSFLHDHGANAVPVTTNEELALVPTTHKPILVNESHKNIIMSSPMYSAPAPVQLPSLKQKVQEWINEWHTCLDAEAVNKLQDILEGHE